jgi:hypothetical protein
MIEPTPTFPQGRKIRKLIPYWNTHGLLQILAGTSNIIFHQNPPSVCLNYTKTFI